MPDYVPTNAASSNVTLAKKELKAIAARSDRPGLIYLGQWGVALALTGVDLGKHGDALGVASHVRLRCCPQRSGLRDEP